jgi:hypothetical protein
VFLKYPGEVLLKYPREVLLKFKGEDHPTIAAGKL